MIAGLAPTRPTFATQLGVVVRVQAAKFKREWFYYVGFPLLASLGMVWLRQVITDGRAAEAGADRYLAGAIVVSGMFSSLNSVTYDAAQARLNREVQYYRLFPMSRLAIVTGLVVLPVLFALPSIVLTAVIGSAILDVPLEPNGWFPIGILLSQVTFAALGVVIGFHLPTKLATSSSSAACLLMMLFTPVLVRPSELPWVVRAVSPIFPSSHASAVLSVGTTGAGTTGSAAVHALVLLAMAGALVGILVTMASWRET